MKGAGIAAAVAAGAAARFLAMGDVDAAHAGVAVAVIVGLPALAILAVFIAEWRMWK